jgi:hypothetical protein
VWFQRSSAVPRHSVIRILRSAAPALVSPAIKSSSYYRVEKKWSHEIFHFYWCLFFVEESHCYHPFGGVGGGDRI